jgi:hypothetical protein
MAKQPRWQDKKSCRTCRFARATDRDRSYQANGHGVRCLFPVHELPWPEFPHSLTAAYGVSDQIANMKSGRSKRFVSLTDREGTACPTWEKWTPQPKMEGFA